MANNTGTLIIAPIRPQASNDPIATAFSNEIFGGWHQVDTLVDRDAIIDARKTDGMACYVMETETAYTWKSSTNEWVELLSPNLVTRSEVSDISGSLQSQINEIVQEGTTITSISGSILITQNGMSWNLESIGGNGGSSGIQGRLQLDNINTTFTINHPSIDINNEFPVVSLEVSNANSDLHILGIHNRSSTSFQVTLSGIADSNTYILWHISTQSTVNVDLSQYTLLSTTSSISGSLQSQINAKANTSDLSQYTLLSTTSSISGSLQSQINAITLVAGTNVSIVESPTDTWTISVSGSIGGGSSLRSYQLISTTLQTVSSDLTACDSSSDSGFIITLPTAVGITGKEYIIKKVDSSSNLVRVYTTSSQTVDGNTVYNIINPYDSLTVVSNGSNWLII